MLQHADWRPARDAELLVGLDLGQAQDHSAIAVVEMFRGDPAQVAPSRRRREPWATRLNEAIADHEGREIDQRPFYVCRMIETLPLGTPFKRVAAAAEGVCESLVRHADRFARKPTLIVDASGLGRPVLEFFEASAYYTMVPTEITGGTKRIIDTTTGHAHLGKMLLVSSLMAALGTRRMLLPPGEMGKKIENELHTYQRSYIKRGLNQVSEMLGAPARVGQHDDEVVAIGLVTSYPVGPPPPSPEAIRALREASWAGPLHGLAGGDINRWIHERPSHGVQFDGHGRVDSWW
jgi:hypothetical protein